jgi:hypothetical protein
VGLDAPTTNFVGRNVSVTCNSSGTALWASAKNIKPLADANFHTETIGFVYHRSPIQFSPSYYQNPASESLSPGGQTILFGCPFEVCTVGELKKIPPVLEYLLGSLHVWVSTKMSAHRVGQKHRNSTINSLYLSQGNAGDW